MRAARALPLLALLQFRCSQGDPSGFTDAAATLTTTTTSSASSFTGDPTTTTGGPGTTDPGTSAATTSSSTSAATTGGTTDASTSTSSSSSSSSASSSSSGGSSGDGPPVCGDGLVEGDELCDDGNADEQDACLADCTAGQALLVLAGTGDAPGLFSRWIPGLGWSTSQAGATLTEAALAPAPAGGGALAAVRRAGPVQQDINELAYATWSPDQPDALGNFADVGNFGYGLDGPALATAGDAAVLAFLGTDNKHYSALYTGGAWSPFGPIPAGMVQIQAFGPSAAALAAGAVETYAVYAGDDGKLYYSLKSSPGGAWQASSQSTAPPVLKALTPAALVDDMGDLLIAYVRQADGKIAVVKLITPQNAWTTEVLVHADAVTDAELAFLRTDGGAYYLAWRRAKAQSIHAVRGTAHDAWGAPFTVEAPAAATAPPALARGLLGAEAELLYPVGGQLRHARLTGDAAELADVPDATKLVGRPAALRVQLVP